MDNLNTMENSVTDLNKDEIAITDGNKNPTPDVSCPSDNISKKHKREVTINTLDKNNETLVITQQVELKKQRRALRAELGRNYRKKLEDINMIICDRIVPNCTRRKCEGSSARRLRNQKCYRKMMDHRKSKSKSKSSKSKGKSKQTRDHSMSPISLSSTESGPKEISYEDVSSDSLSSCSDKELDTLIKRTKEREKYMTVSSNFLCDLPHRTSTPQINQTSNSHTTVINTPPLHDLTFSPISSHGCEAGSLQQEETALDISPYKLNLSDIRTECVVDTNAHLTYYHYYNVSNNNEYYFKNENIDRFNLEHHIFHSKKSHNG